METGKFTDPFSGAELEGVIINDVMHLTHPIHNIKMMFDIEDEYVKVPLFLFEHIDLVTFADAAKILDITIQGVHNLSSREVLQTIELSGKKYFKLKDVLKYKEERKRGRPRKAK